MATKKVTLEFDPFAIFRDGPVEKDAQGLPYPGEMFERQINDSHALIKSTIPIIKSGRDKHGVYKQVQDEALALMNAWMLALPPGGKKLNISEEEGEKQRSLMLGSFLAGWHSFRLSVLVEETKPVRLPPSDVVAAYARKLSAQLATDARVSRVEHREKAMQDAWASGEHVSRDRCAYVEWQRLGFPSFRQGRNALRNTPEPLR